jgi:leucyl-tRNA synthetase
MDAVESPAVGDTPGNPGGIRRSTRKRKQVMNWQPAMKGMKYVFAALVLATNELGTLKCRKREILEPILILLAPFAPHISEELWHQLEEELMRKLLTLMLG